MRRTLSHLDIIDHLFKLSTSRHYLIAFSGGLDSSVLLHLMYKASLENNQVSMSAIHVDHGISAKSYEWSEFCKIRCQELDIYYQSFTIDVAHSKGDSLEASARECRYALLGRHLKSNNVLLTAHHQDDQCETLLLQMLRGSGLAGIASMPEIQEFADGYLARPLLNIDREKIRRYAIDENLSWIEDESNLDTNMDRNFIRHNVIPSIKGRWPSASKTIARTARHAGETIYLANILGKQDFAKAKEIGTNILFVSVVRQFSYARQRNILRYWIREHGKPIPSSIIIERILTEIIESGADRNPKVKWNKVEVRRFRDRLYILDTLPETDAHTVLSLEQACESLPLGQLLCEYSYGKGINADLLQDRSISIRFRKGGESIYPYNSSYPRRVKKLMSEYGIPPWLRDLMPLVYIDDEIIAIPGVCVDKNWMALTHQSSINITWQLPAELEEQNLPFS